MIKRPSRKIKSYEIERSPLYRIASKRKLAEILGIDVSMLASVEKFGLTSQYNIFTDKATRRFITEPKDELARIHKRLLHLFRRIAPPEYVHSAIKKRSYKTNAMQHCNADIVLKIDIKKFFPSVKFHYIYEFFSATLRCAPDVATILAKLCTVKTNKYETHLPTGSCISPLLSFLANRKLFDAIKRLCDERGCTFTLYVDDMTVSGKNASRELLTMIAIEIHNHGYGYHKIQTYEGVPATVTGLIVGNGKLALPHKRAKRIRELSDALEVATGPWKPKLLASLVGRLSEAEQINPAYKTQRGHILSRYADEWQGIVAARAKKASVKRR